MNMDCSRPGSPSRWRARVRHRIQPVEAPGGRSPGADQQSSRHTGERPGRPDSQRRFRARRPAPPPLRLRAAARSKSTTLRLRPQIRQASDLRKTPPDARSPPDGTWLAAALSGTQTRSNNVDSDLDGCRDHGEAGRERWVGWAVLAHNLRQVSRAMATNQSPSWRRQLTHRENRSQAGFCTGTREPACRNGRSLRALAGGGVPVCEPARLRAPGRSFGARQKGE